MIDYEELAEAMGDRTTNTPKPMKRTIIEKMKDKFSQDDR